MPVTNITRPGAYLRALALAALVVGLAAAKPEKRSTVTNVTLQEIGGATQLTFNADREVQCTEVPGTDASMVVLDITGADHTLPRSSDLTSQVMKGMRTDIWHTDDGAPVTRVTVFLKESGKHWIESSEKGFTLIVEPVAAAADASVMPIPADMPPAIDVMAADAIESMPADGGAAPDGDSGVWEVSVEGVVPPPVSEVEPMPAPEAPARTGSAPKAEAAPEEPSAIHQLLQAPRTFSPEINDAKSMYADGGSRVSLDVQGADVRTVMRSLSEYSGVNVVVGKEVMGNVTVNLTEVPWLDALNTICRTQALGWVEEDGIIRVETLKNLRKEEVNHSMADKQLEDLQPLATQIIRAVYAAAVELKPAIEKTLTARGHVEVDYRTNSLVITDVSKRVSAAVEMIKHLDSRTPQIEITAKLVDVDARYTRDLGINWGVGQIHSTDQAWSAEGAVNANSVLTPTGSVQFGLVRSWGTINAMLSALEQDNKADIISNPRITTVNNREARILVGRKIPLLTLDKSGNTITQLVTIGITLYVTPHINDDRRITLDLHPEVSDLASQATVQGGIIINTSEADTRVIVDDAETAVIGGLIRSNTSTVKKGVPVLKDIPLVGAIFSGSSEVKEKRELLIFITPKIITNWAETH